MDNFKLGGRRRPWEEVDGVEAKFSVDFDRKNTTVLRPNSACSGTSVSSRTESESGISSSSDSEHPVYVSLADFQTLKKNMDACKAACKQSVVDIDGNSFRSSSGEKSTSEEQCRSRLKRKCCIQSRDSKVTSDSDISESSGSSGGKRSKIVTAEKSCVPNYSISCCSRTFSSSPALFSHLRQAHNVGTSPHLRRRCKLCKTFVNDDLVMLHIELCHTITDVRAFKIEFGHVITSENPEAMYMELLPDED